MADSPTIALQIPSVTLTLLEDRWNQRAWDYRSGPPGVEYSVNQTIADLRRAATTGPMVETSVSAKDASNFGFALRSAMESAEAAGEDQEVALLGMAELQLGLQFEADVETWERSRPWLVRVLRRAHGLRQG